MQYDFDKAPRRCASDSLKWNTYGDDVLPLWIADMDFSSPLPVIRALQDRLEHPVFGYGKEPALLKELVVQRLGREQGWRVEPEAIVFLPGLVTGLNVTTRGVGSPGDAVLVNTPVYPPFLSAPTNQERRLLTAEQVARPSDCGLRYEIDFDALERTVSPETRLFILCNPHNPTGRAFSEPELRHLAEFCLRHDLLICSDEIHCDLLLGESRHRSIAQVAPEVEARTITLLAPSKTFNIPGLGCSLAVIPDASLRRRFRSAAAGIVPDVNLFGFAAAVAAYQECEDWLTGLKAYLTDNRDFLVKFLSRNLPEIGTTVPEATYLAWLDCRQLGPQTDPYRFFLEKAGVALSDGRRFGPGGEGFVRLNFGCTREVLAQALERMRQAVREA
ncbi:MAG: PatB family C-S lyase [Acidobacteriota bacterium]|nr:MAG: PatB family C-S lyase [Acidobacteriota bacterium]